ncbi:short neuropeptide F-like [Penaeus japonicus]|nr:short neuropeptide F-like [Penaeus japonicus]
MTVTGLRCVLVLACCCLALTQLAAALPPPLQDYDGEYHAMGDVYDWLVERGLERRAQPSMRLRFGKRDMGWQVSQRSMPSLRLRFGKRTLEQNEPLQDHDLVRKDGRTPALRLRFGKRDPPFVQDEDVAAPEQ